MKNCLSFLQSEFYRLVAFLIIKKPKKKKFAKKDKVRRRKINQEFNEIVDWIW